MGPAAVARIGLRHKHSLIIAAAGDPADGVAPCLSGTSAASIFTSSSPIIIDVSAAALPTGHLFIIILPTTYYIIMMIKIIRPSLGELLSLRLVLCNNALML